MQTFSLNHKTPWNIARLHNDAHIRPAVEVVVRQCLLKSQCIQQKSVVLFNYAANGDIFTTTFQDLPYQQGVYNRVLQRILPLPRDDSVADDILKSAFIKARAWEIAHKTLNEFVDRRLDPVQQHPYVDNVLLVILKELFPKVVMWVADIEKTSIGIHHRLRAVVDVSTGSPSFH